MQTFAERLHSAWVRLQIDVNCFVDSDSDKLRGKDAPSGIRQVIHWTPVVVTFVCCERIKICLCVDLGEEGRLVPKTYDGQKSQFCSTFSYFTRPIHQHG